MTRPGLDIVSAMSDPRLFGSYFHGVTWAPWRAVLKGAYGLPMTDDERELFRVVAQREPPKRRVRELWIIAGRRAGKDSIASLILGHSAALFTGRDRLRRGERALCVALACDRDQAKILLGYARSYFSDIPMLNGMVRRETAAGFELNNGVDVSIGTNSFRSVRGRPILCAVLDEVAFYRDETSATPDEETYRALVPGMATLDADAMLVGISSPYRKSGLLYKRFSEHYGKDSEDVLVIRAPSTTLNPTLDPKIIEKALREDPVAAAAEWMAEFRDDISGWAGRELVEAAVDRNVAARPPLDGFEYVSFIDASGGVKDSYTAAVAHSEDGLAVLDCVVEIRAPFNAESATAQIAQTLRSYRCGSTVGDRYAAGWVVQAFERHSVKYQHSERDRSALYLDLLPMLSSGRVRLIDNPRLVSQFSGLERRTFSNGRDRVDHAPGGSDDLCNAAAGALCLAAAPKPQPFAYFVNGRTIGGEAPPLPQPDPGRFARLMGF